MNTTSPRTTAKDHLIWLIPAFMAMLWLVSKAQWFWNHRPDLQFGWIVLLLVGFICFDAAPKLSAPTPRLGWPSFALPAAGLCLMFLVQIYNAAFGMSPASLTGLAVGAYLCILANIHLVYGWQGCRILAFPLIFFLIALPMPSAIYNPIVSGLQSQVATVNVQILNLIGVPAERVGSLIQLANGTVGVDEACSGIRSLQSTVMATLFIGYLTLSSRVLQVLLFVSGIVLAVGGNLIRSLYLSMTANRHGIEAVSGVHDAAGWSILVFTAAGVALCAWILGSAEKRAKALPRRNSPPVATPLG